MTVLSGSKIKFKIALLTSLFVIAIGLAETLVSYVDVKTGLFIHIGIFFALLISAFLLRRDESRNFFLAMSLAPLIRILNLTMPLADLQQLYWYLAISVPLLSAGYLVVGICKFRPADIGLTPGWFPGQLFIVMAGPALGMIEYRILNPMSVARSLSLEHVWAPVIILLICTGFTEEVIFRGIMYKAARNIYGVGCANFITSLIFTFLHLSYRSYQDLIFVFSVAVLFSLMVEKTNSIIGVTIAHGIINVVLYVVAPLMNIK